VPTSAPGPNEVLVKVEYAGVTPLDTAMADFGLFIQSYPTRLGFNAAGTVVKVGSDVKSLVVGDKVTAYGPAPDAKALQQYGVFDALLCAKVPESQDLASAATYPDNFVTAYYLLFVQLGLPAPSTFPATTPPTKAASPILVYGAGSTVAQYIVQLLKLAGYTNILTTASKKHHAYLSELGATKNFDYASPTLADEIREFAGASIPIAIDVISTFGTLGAISKFIDPKGKLAVLLPVKEGQRLHDGPSLFEIPKERSPFGAEVEIVYVGTFEYMMTNPESKYLMSTLLAGLLASASLKPNKVVLLDGKFGDLKGRADEGLNRMRAGAVSGEKLVVKIH